MNKIVSKEDFEKIRDKLKAEGKTVAMCHGVFDLVHLGHIIHLKKAKEIADLLVVSITAAKYVRKGEGRPYFSDDDRRQVLSSLEFVDYVLLSEGYTADDVIRTVRPDFYVKGSEYKVQEDDVTEEIQNEVSLVEEFGGKVYYTEGEVFSSTNLINRETELLSDEVKAYIPELIRDFDFSDIKKLSESMKKLKVLVVGDVIIDEYNFCKINGMMSKDDGYSTKFLHSERYLGGSLAVAGHLSAFSENVILASIMGTESDIHSHVLNELGGRLKMDLIFSDERETVVKRRFVVQNVRRKELRKIFSVNNLPEPMTYDEKSKALLLKKLKAQVKEADLVVLSDFGHGLVDFSVMELLQKEAKFLAVNCQTNSSNLGKNLMSKYSRADVFTMNEKELELARPAYQFEAKSALEDMAKHLGGSGLLTVGAAGAIGYYEGEFYECPAFTLNITDTVGAGDAFFSLCALAAALKAPMKLTTFMGSVAGAIASNIIGNKEFISRVNYLKFVQTLMNY